VNQLQTEAKPPSLVGVKANQLDTAPSAQHAITEEMLHSFTNMHIYIYELWSLPISPHDDKRQTESLNVAYYINHIAIIIPKLIFSVTH
jgi:hypothetical protein